MNLKSIILVAGSINLFSSASAQDPDSNTVQEIIPVEITGIRVNTRAPFAFTNLMKAELQQKNDGKDLPYVLDQSPSVLINSDAGTGVGYTDMRIRGTDNQRINFTINGIPVNDAESQGTFFVNFPDLLSTSGSIQVQRGVGSSTNGSGAFGASVNISNIDQAEEASASVINSFGSFRTWRHTITAGTGKLKGGFNFDARLSRISSEGFIDRASSDLRSLQFIAGWTSADERSNIKFNLFTGREKTGQAWNGVPQDSLESNRSYNELGLKDDGTYYDDQTDNYQQDYYQLFFTHQFSRNWSANAALFLTRGKGYYNEYRMGEAYADYGLPDPDSNTAATSLIRQLWLDNYYYGTVLGLHYAKNNTVVDIGAAVSRYEGEHYGRVKWATQGIPADHEWYHNKAGKTDANIYAKWEQKIAEGLYTFLDLQLRAVDYTINGFRKNPEITQANQYLFFNPKAGITFYKNSHKFFLSGAVANKEPNRDDFEAGLNEVPRPETLYDIEAGYQYASHRFRFNGNLYYMHYNNQLVSTGKINDVGAYTRTNVDKSFRSGIEMQVQAEVSKWFSLQGNMTLSQNKIRSFTEYIDDYDKGGQLSILHSGTDIALSPSFISGLTAAFRPFDLSAEQELRFDITGKYVGRQYLDNTSDVNRSIDPFGLLSIRAAYSFSLPYIKSGRIILNVNNLLNEQYETKGYTFSYISGGMNTFNYYFPQAGINYSITLGLDF